ncbi:MAG: Holliday junction branch migration DNA helicase RuvB [Gemmatimonadetes bacterium]|nr:Holliday junction branch migration DNA helicase RuvB [Gemmatimonadota bacterium]
MAPPASSPSAAEPRRGFTSTLKGRAATQPEPRHEEVELEETLRPAALEDFVGQTRVIANLRTSLSAAQARAEPIDHCLFCGPPGLGKTTLAHILARELGAQLRATSGPALEKAGDLAGLLTNLRQGDILFIDEIHRLRPVVEEYLYPAMEDFSLDILIDSGPSARSIHIPLARFTLVGATTRQGLLTSPLRSRFGMVHRLDFYEPAELVGIVQRSARILGVPLEDEAALEIASRSRGTARVANRLLKWARDFAQVEGSGRIDRALARAALAALQVDEVGLDEMDGRILRTLIEKFEGGPVGLNTLAVAVGEDPGTLEEVHEPFLIQRGFLRRTPRGREATPSAYAHLGRKPERTQSTLF